MLNVMVTGLLCISMLLVASSCNLCLFTVKFYWNIKKKKKKKGFTHILTDLIIMYYPRILVRSTGVPPGSIQQF